jgi:hypothetical protein
MDGSRSAQMPRYFFHIHVDKAVQPDPLGLEITNLDDAIADANQARVEIMEEDALDQLWFEIRDRSGHVIATVPTIH